MIETLSFSFQKPNNFPIVIKFRAFEIINLTVPSVSTYFCRFLSAIQNWTPPSIRLLVGTGSDPAYLPMCAGLSSSSALVVASAMAVMRATHTYVEPVSCSIPLKHCQLFLTHQSRVVKCILETPLQSGTRICLDTMPLP